MSIYQWELIGYNAQKVEFTIYIFQQMRPDLQESADLFTFTEEILHGKLHILCSDTFVRES